MPYTAEMNKEWSVLERSIRINTDFLGQSIYPYERRAYRQKIAAAKARIKEIQKAGKA